MGRPTFRQRIAQGASFLFGLRSTDPDLRSRELALRTLFLGTMGLTFVAFLVVCNNYFFLHLTYLGARILLIGVLGVILAGMYAATLRQHLRGPAYGLLAFYFIAASAAMWQWGLETPTSILLFALVVIFAGIILGARYSLYTMGLVILLQLGYVFLLEGGYAHPDTSWLTMTTHYYEVVIFAIILGNIALISWLFNRSMEHSLRRAQRSEQALKRQKQLLEVKVAERTRQVQIAHLERVQELYRFAELGHMSVALLHDMANYLSVISLDIQDLQQARKNRSAAMQRVQQSIAHLDNLIKQVRHQIKGETASGVRFNVAEEIDQVIKILGYKADAARVTLERQTPPDKHELDYTGSINHFWQVIMNLVSNGIDACTEGGVKRVVIVAAQRSGSDIVIKVSDFGKGIPRENLDKIFEPFYSTKRDSTGMGLAITKQMVERDFGGTIAVESDTHQGATFTVTLPLKSPIDDASDSTR
jgi:signal transduction histidine kinase